MKKGLTVLGGTILGGVVTGVVSGMIVNNALKYDAKKLEEDLKEKDKNSIKKNMAFKDKVIAGVSFGLGATLVSLGCMAAGSALTDAVIENDRKLEFGEGEELDLEEMDLYEENVSDNWDYVDDSEDVNIEHAENDEAEFDSTDDYDNN